MAKHFSAAPARCQILARAQATEVPLAELAAAIQLPKRTLHRVLSARYLRWDVADRVAIALGHHPYEFWPDWFDETHTIGEGSHDTR